MFIGGALVSFYPQIGDELANLFIATGMRDFLLDLLYSMKTET